MSVDPWSLFAPDESDPVVVSNSGSSATSSTSASVSSSSHGSSPKATILSSLTLPTEKSAISIPRVSIPWQRTLPTFLSFLDSHGEDTLEDLQSNYLPTITAPDERAAVTAMGGSLSRLSESSRALRGLIKTPPPATPPPAEKAHLEAMLGSSRALAEVAWAWMSARGSWPHIAWREAYVLGKLGSAVPLAAAGHQPEAMEAVDLALILGAPPGKVEGLVGAVSAGCRAMLAADAAIHKAQRGTTAAATGAAASMKRGEDAGALLPTVPPCLEKSARLPPQVYEVAALLPRGSAAKKGSEAAPPPSPSATVDAKKETSAAPAPPASARTPLLVARRMGMSLADAAEADLLDAFEAPSSKGGKGRNAPAAAAAGSSKKGGAARGGGSKAAIEAYIQQQALLEHPTLSSLRALTAPPLPPISQADFEALHVKASKPLVLSGACRDWPALRKWRDLAALSEAHGHRTVPIEIGQHLSGTWSEEPRLFRDFLSQFIGPCLSRWGWGAGEIKVEAPSSSSSAANSSSSSTSTSVDSESKASSTTVTSLSSPSKVSATPSSSSSLEDENVVVIVRPRDIAYLAQHNLFDQIPAFLSDFEPPVYAGPKIGAINAWFGTAGTVTRLHFDSYENLLTQVWGYKLVKLYAPQDSAKLYPIKKAATTGASGNSSSSNSSSSNSSSSSSSTTVQENISAFNVDSPDFDAHPQARNAQAYVTLLGPGDILYIPAKWWHHVRSISASFSLNFWF